MLWDEFLGIENTDDILDEKARILAQLILQSATTFHELAAAISGKTYSILEKQFSDAETTALQTALVLSLVRRYVSPEQADFLSASVLQLVADFLDKREPCQVLSFYFKLRYHKLINLVDWKRDPNAVGFSPWIKSSYEEQERLLKIGKNAMLIGVFEHSIANALRRWALHQLVTGTV